MLTNAMPSPTNTTSLPDLQPALTNTDAVVHGLYRGLLGRDAEPGALAHWGGVIRSEGHAAGVLSAILGSDEYRQGASTLRQRDEGLAKLLSAAAQRLQAQPLTVVDVGAQELETEDHVYSPLAKGGLPCRVIGFEPLAEKIAQSMARNPAGNVTLYPTFIGDGHPHRFHINSYDATSSLLPFNTELTALLVGLSDLRTVRTDDVGTQTLDTVLAKVGQVDFLKLDIQGFELAALQHASSVLARTNVVHCEVSFAEIYQGQALFAEVEQLLRSAGFDFMDLSTSCRYPYHNASNAVSADRLGWGDAVFFRRAQTLPTARDLLVQALIALCIYQKHSLGAYLLERYDECSGSELATIAGCA